MFLADFEKDLDSKVLARGQEYYQTGRVLSITEKNGVFLARVEGNERYRVEVRLSNEGEVVFSDCNCPYDLGEYCKHQVAVFWALREKPALVAVSPGSVKSGKTLESLVADAPRQVLEEALLSLAEEHPFIKRTLKLALEEKTVEEELKECKALIRSTISANGGRRGFVEYRQVRSALMGAETVSTRARRHLEVQAYYRAFVLSLSILQEMMNLVAKADDSSGYIGDVIAESLDMIHDSILPLSGAESDQAFKILLRESAHTRHEVFSDPQIFILKLLAAITDTTKRRKALEGAIDELVRKEAEGNYHSKYFEEEMAIIRYHLLIKFRESNAAALYLNDNIRLPGIRSIVINQAIEQEDYALAEQICLQGEENDHQYAGLVSQWQEIRSEIYRRTGRLEEWRALVRGFAIGGSMEYYHEYKNSFPGSEWQVLSEEFLQQVKARNRWSPLYPQLLIEESRLDLLRDHVQKYPKQIENYAQALHSFDPQMVLSTYISHIEEQASESGDRKKYKNLGNLLREFGAVCGSVEAVKLRDLLIQKYPRRPTMVDELKRVEM